MKIRVINQSGRNLHRTPKIHHDAWTVRTEEVPQSPPGTPALTGPAGPQPGLMEKPVAPGKVLPH